MRRSFTMNPPPNKSTKANRPSDEIVQAAARNAAKQEQQGSDHQSSPSSQPPAAYPSPSCAPPPAPLPPPPHHAHQGQHMQMQMAMLPSQPIQPMMASQLQAGQGPITCPPPSMMAQHHQLQAGVGNAPLPDQAALNISEAHQTSRTLTGDSITIGGNTSTVDQEGNIPSSKRRRKMMKPLTSAAAMATRMTKPSAAPFLPLPSSPDISLRKLIPPKDSPRIRRRMQTALRLQTHSFIESKSSASSPESLTGVGGGENQIFDWSAVIVRARSHPHEAAESYFGPVSDTNADSLLLSSNVNAAARVVTNAAAVAAQSGRTGSPSGSPPANNILTYKPLHAMLKYDPPLDAVEAVLRAHPEAALDVTFEGTALHIASESLVSNMLVLRLLLVAEMAMRKKLAQEREEQEVLEEVKRQHEVEQRRRQRQEDEGRLQQVQEEERRLQQHIRIVQQAQQSPMHVGLVAAQQQQLHQLHQQIQQQQLQEQHRHQQRQQIQQQRLDQQQQQPQQQHVQQQQQQRPQQRHLQQQRPSSRSQSMFSGHNPIRWITERRIPVKTAAMLLKWYPIGAFQRPWDEDGAPADVAMGSHGIHPQDMEAESPLIKIVDDFARDHYDEVTGGGGKLEEEDALEEDVYGYYDSEYSDHEEQQRRQQGGQTTTAAAAGSSVAMTAAAPAVTTQTTATAAAAASMLSPPQQTYQQRERRRKEKRWEKFLHILYATDLVLQSTRRKRPSSPEENDSPQSSTKTSSINANRESLTAASASDAHQRTSSHNDNAGTSTEATSSGQQQPSNETPFRPVHAWIRCLTTPHLGLEHCRPYGAWSVLRVMGQRIPSEFTVRDATDGNRTAFQTLAESKARDCKLSLEEVKDVVECLMDADYRSAFLPRKSDGRLIGHVALENGWPCKDLFSRKTSATCA